MRRGVRASGSEPRRNVSVDSVPWISGMQSPSGRVEGMDPGTRVEEGRLRHTNFLFSGTKVGPVRLPRRNCSGTVESRFVGVNLDLCLRGPPRP